MRGNQGPISVPNSCALRDCNIVKTSSAGSLILSPGNYLRTSLQNCRRMAYEISIEGVQIKGYQHFKIKAPTGTPLVICSETNEHDPFALACYIPNEMDQIPESLRTMEMSSKSQKKQYTLREVLGSQIGRVQYFLNRELSFLLNCGKITSIQGTVRGEPTITARPTTQQKFHKNKQAGGGAYIPASLKITGPRPQMTFVLERLRATLHECENGDEMSIDLLRE